MHEDRGLELRENKTRTEHAQCTHPNCGFRAASFENRNDALKRATDHARETGHKVNIRITTIVTISPEE